MLEFNSGGFLIPHSLIPSTIEELEIYFAIKSPGDIRKRLFQNYITYVEDLKKFSGLKNLKQWIDGSFVTKKENPVDIDIVTFIDFKIMLVNKAGLKNFHSPTSRASYGLDCYLVAEYPENHKLHFSYRADCAYWINLFGETKPDHRRKTYSKGFLEIIV